MPDGVLHRGGFETAVHHAVGTLLVVTRAVAVPVGLFHELTKALRIAFAQQVTRPLPTEDRACGIAPRGALVSLVAGEEVEEEARLAERPRPPALPALEHVAEKLLRRGAVEEVLLVRRTLVGVTRRNGDAVDAERFDLVEERRDLGGIGALEERAVDVHPETTRFRRANRSDGALVDARLAHGMVVHRLVTVEVHGPDEERARLELRETLFEKERVGAE